MVKYSYDGADLLFEKDEGDTLRIRCLYGPGIDHILESVDSVGTKQHFADALGSVTRITDSTGSRYKLMVFDSYGNLTSDTGSVQADYVSYTGREAERDLGIYFYRARYYDPLTGRFMVRDPLGFAAGDVNLYKYVGNNPASLRDPLGLLGEGIEEGGDFLGHSDLYWGNRFDFTREDRSLLTTWWQPFGGIQRHFRNLPDVERELMIAIADRDLVLFESLMHQGQDYFSHYSQGYRWYPTSWNDLPGHAEDGTMPDRNMASWEKANCWTRRWVEIWFAAYER